MTWGQYLFSFHGRLNRARYWSFLGVTYAIVLVIIVIAIAAIASARVSARTISTSATHLNPVLLIALGMMLFALEVTFVVASLAVSTKRLHDRAKSAWWLLVFVILPVALNLIGASTRTAGGGTSGMFSVLAFAFALWGFVEMGCLRGTDGANRFGPDPLSYTPDVAAATFN